MDFVAQLAQPVVLWHHFWDILQTDFVSFWYVNRLP